MTSLPAPEAAEPVPLSPLERAYLRLPAARTTIAALHDGWRLQDVHFVLAPLVLADLVHTETGEHACWYMDLTGRMLGNTPDCIDAVLAGRIRSGLQTVLMHRTDEPERFRRFVAELNRIERSVRLPILYHVVRKADFAILDAIGFGPDQERRFAVRTGPGGVALLIDESLEWPITSGGAFLWQFHDGWRVSALVCCFAPMLILEMEHSSGARASRILDAACDAIDDDTVSDPRCAAVIRQKAPLLFRRYWYDLIALNDTLPSYRPPSFLLLCRAMLDRALYLATGALMPEPLDQMIGAGDGPILLPPAPDRPEGLVLTQPHLDRALRNSLFEAGLEALRGGSLRWPSPVDGTDAVLEAVFAPSEYAIAYQFRDRHGLRFMVATGERDCTVMGLFLPYENHFLCGETTPANWWFRHHVQHEFWHLILRHALLHGATIRGRRRNGGGEIAATFTTDPLLHIGHYLWNELSGLDRLVATMKTDAPRCLVIDGADGRAELFGPLERLFPALTGKVERDIVGRSGFAERVYGSNLIPVRFTGSFIGATLRETIRRHVMTTPDAQAVSAQRPGAGPGPVLIVGLRLEDRTFTDTPGFLRALVDHLDRNWPGAVIVLDGRNRAPGTTEGAIIRSIKDAQSHRDPLAAELEIVEGVAAYAAGRRVSVLSTVGQSVETSLAWCEEAKLCLAPWGAGLAKYRWIANLPSVILTSRYNLMHRHDLDIYHAPRFMETPAVLVLPDPDRVIDRPDVRGNAPVDSDRNGRECFEIEPAYVWSLLDGLLAA